MIRMNLLPIAERPSKWPVNRLLLLSGILVMMIFCSIYSYSIYKVKSMESELQDIRNQYQALEPTRRVMAIAENKEQQFNKKNKILAVLTKERPSLHGIIQHLTSVTSTKIKFTEMVKSDKGTIQIKGWADNYLSVAEFMKTIENDQVYTDPVLTNLDKDSATQVTKFEIVVKPRGI